MASARPVCVVTGCSTGIGKAVASALAAKDFEVIMACRPSAKAITARDEVAAATQNKDITLLDLDVSKSESVRAFVKHFEELNKPLNVLVNNAGVMMTKYQKTEEDIELTVATNTVGPFLLTELLLSHLVRSGTGANPSRIINVGSALEKKGEVTADNLLGEGSADFDPWRAYSNSKQALTLWTYQLHQRMEATGAPVLVNATHPGFCGTDLGREQPLFIRALMWPFKRFLLRTPEQGAESVVHLATLSGDAAVRLGGGNYLGKTQECELSSERSRDGELGKQIVNRLASHCGTDAW